MIFLWPEGQWTVKLFGAHRAKKKPLLVLNMSKITVLNWPQKPFLLLMFSACKLKLVKLPQS